MKNKLLIIIFSLFVVSSFNQSFLEAATLHAFIVADTHAENIGESVEMDLEKMETFILRAAKYSNLELNKYVFKDNEANSNFTDSFDQANVEADDVILFYWSGHGFRTGDKDWNENPWPSFSFEHDQTGMDQLDISEYLKEKNPRLIITITDTCNEYMPDWWQPDMHLLMQKGDWMLTKIGYEKMKASYRKLFRETSGLIMCAGSKPGQYSWCNWSGAFFTSSFLAAFESEITKPNANWDGIFSRSRDNLNRYFQDFEEGQTPLILLDINQ